MFGRAKWQTLDLWSLRLSKNYPKRWFSSLGVIIDSLREDVEMDGYEPYFSVLSRIRLRRVLRKGCETIDAVEMINRIENRN